MLNFLCKGINGRYGVPRIPVRKSVMFFYGLFVLFLCATQARGDCVTPCPTGCVCWKSANKECTVNCTNAGLSGVPNSSEFPDSRNDIKIVYLNNNSISAIGANDLKFMTNLQEIHLQGNIINSIDSKSFQISSLLVIDLSNNPLTVLGVDVFTHCIKMEILNLSQTQITGLSDSTFERIHCLKELDLSGNHLQSIREEVLKTLKCLEVLKLSGNAFANMASLYIDFNLFKNLRELDISDNRFTTFLPNILSLLTNLQKLNIANNPFDCTCDLMPFRNELVTLEAKGLEMLDRNNVNCSNAPTVNLLDQSSERFWCCDCPSSCSGTRLGSRRDSHKDDSNYNNDNGSCSTHKSKRSAPAWKVYCKTLTTTHRFCVGPDKLGSCYYDSEAKEKNDVLFTLSTPATDNQTCIEVCFNNNSTYGIFEDGLCMCGYKNEDTSNQCWCALKVYVDGSNMACTTSTGTNIVYVSSVYLITAGLTINPFDQLTAGKSQDFTAVVQLQTIVQYIWSFGDSSETFTGTISGLSYTNSHTYAIPGTYTLTVTACTQQSACTSITVPVVVKPLITSDDLEITCPSVTPSLSSTITITGKISAGYDTEINWSKLPTDNVTATTEGQCDSSWDFFRGRCLKTLPSSYNYGTATSTCNGGKLLTIHYPEEITQVLSTYTTLSTIYLGGQKNGNGYTWANGNQAYFMVDDVTDSSIGDCIVIDRTSGELKGIDCSTSHSIICQQTPNTECPYGGYYYSGNNHCYQLYKMSVIWTDAVSACEALTNQSQLAIMDSQNLATFVINNVFGTVTQPAWIGLTDREAETYLMWTNKQSVVNYNPVGTAPETDCITVDSAGSWSHFSCKEVNYYVCQYSLRETVKIPTYLAGIGRLAATGVSYDITSINSTTSPTTGRSVLSIFPGLTISHIGEIRKWNFQTNTLSKSYDVTFQVYTPECTSATTFINPGCDGNGARYGSCSSTVTSCTALPSCSEVEESCSHTGTCLPVSDPCNCNLLSNITYAYCSTPYVGTRPTYRLTGQTTVTLPAGPSDYFSINADGLNVSPGDVLAFQAFTSDDVIKCENSDISMLQNSLQTFQTSPPSVGDVIDTSSYNWHNNTACYFQAVYTVPESVSLSPFLQYSTVAGNYTYEFSLTGSNINKSCTITVEEDVGDLTWIYPSIRSSSLTDTFYVEADVKTYLVFVAKRGTNLQVEWEIEGNVSTSTFYSSCPSSVEAQIGSLCDLSNYRKPEPFAYIQHTFTYNSGNSIPIKITVQNNVGSKSKTLASDVFLPLSVGFNLTDFTHGYLVEINTAINFTISVLSGNPTSYNYMINGSSMSTSTTTAFTHTFTSKNVWEVTVEIFDSFSSSNASVIVSSRYPADVQSLALIGVPSKVTVGNAVQFEATATVNANAFIYVQWEFESGTISESLETTSTSLQLIKSHAHTINGTYTFRLTITDEFDNVKSVTQSIRIVEEIPSVSLSATPTSIKTGSNIDFVATVPNVAIKDYGSLIYQFNFNDTNIESSTSKEKLHIYSTAGIYYVTVTVSNEAQTVEDTVVVYVLDDITGLSIVSDRIVVLNTSISINAFVTTGNSITYNFDIPDFGLSSGNVTNNVYKVVLDQTGLFNVTLTAWNDLGASTVSKEIYVVDTDTLEIIKFTHDKYKATNTVLNVEVDVLYYNYADLILTWEFAGFTQKGGGGLSTSYTFTTAGIYNFTVTIQSSSSGKFIKGYSTVEIQDSLSGLVVSDDGPVALPSVGSVTVTTTATTNTGTSIRYTWDYDGKIETTTSNTVTVTRSVEIEETVVVMVWNDVSSLNGTTTYKVQQIVEGLKITCLNCTENNGNSYLQSTKTASFVASLTFGTNVTYNWDFGDTSTGIGISQTHAYSLPQSYTINLSAVNDVGTVTATFVIYVQEEIDSVSIIVASNPVFVNSNFILTATPVGGTDITYAWQDCGTCDQNHQVSPVYTTGMFNTSGKYIVSVKAYNEINFKTNSQLVTVLDYITSVNISSNLVQDQYASVNQIYIFSAQVNTELDLSYAWSVKRSSTIVYSLTGNDKNFTYTFIGIHQYEVVVTVSNPLGSTYTSSIKVYVQQEISGAYVTFDKPSLIATGEALQITAVTITGTELRYKWTLENSTGQYLLPDTTKSFTYTFIGNGHKNFILEVQNDLGNASANKTISVMEAVSGVRIHSIVNESYPYIAVNTTITFSAIVGSGENYTTTWTVIDGVSSPLTFSNTDLTHDFQKSGTFKIMVLVQNSVSSDQYELTVHVQGSITSLSLIPDTNLAQTGQSVNFSASYNMDADNLIFEWNIEGTVTNVTSSTLTHVFTTAGIITAYIKVYNHISMMSTQIDIMVEVPISGLGITGCNTTQVINTAVSATASVILGTDVTFNYKLDTGPTTSIFGTGASLSHTYSTTGVYNLYVNASNQVSLESIQCIFTIIGPITGLSVSTSNSEFFVDYTVQFQVSGINLIGVTYSWHFLPTNENVISTDSLLQKNFTTAGTYSYDLTVSNTISSSTISGSVVIEPLHCDVMTVTKGGNSEKIRKKSLTSTFEVTVDKKGCTAYMLSYLWEVYASPNGCTGTLSNPVMLSSSIITNTPKLLLDKSLDVGVYCVQLTTKYEKTPLIQVVGYKLTVVHSDLAAIISGGSKLKYPSSQAITVDGSGSFDPDNSTSSLQYSWACSKSYPLTPPTGYVDACTGIISSTSSSVTMETANILPGETYQITLTVSALGRTSGTFDIEIEILSSEVPVAIMSCITCGSKKSYMLNAGDHVAFSGSCLNCLITDTIYYEWTVYSVVSNVRTQLTLTSDMTTTGINRNNLVITGGNLPTASSYIFKLEISKTDATGTTLQSFSEFEVTANTKATGGSCILATTSNIEPLVDEVEVLCSGFVDPDNSNGELNYKVMSYSKDPSSSTESVIIYYGTLSSPKFHLAPWPGVTRNAVNLQVSVIDEDGAEALALDVDVSVTSTVSNGNQFAFVQNHTMTTLAQLVTENNPTSLLQYGIVLIHEMNEVSRQEALISPTYSHIDDRNTVRNRITLAVLGLPLETKYQQNQKAFILCYLTKYFGECQTSVCQNWILDEVDALKNDMVESAYQGADKSEFTSSLLLEAVSNTMDAVNAAIYSSVNISNVTSLDSQTLQTYRPDISTLDLTTTSISTEDHKEQIILRSFTFGDDIVILNLKTQLQSEDPVIIKLDNIEVLGRRIWTDDIEQSYSSEGCVAVLHSNMLDSLYPTRAEIFQIMMVIAQNPFTWGNNLVDIELNTKVLAAGFTDTSGKEISVSNIADGRKPKFFIMKNGGVSYNITGGSLVNSTDYDPSDGITFSSTIVTKAAAKKILIDTSTGYSGAALHLQVKFSVVTNPSATTNATEVISVYLGKNYEATKSRYETRKDIKMEHMGDKVDHRFYTLFVDFSNFDTDASYSVTVYNDDQNYDVNVSAGIHFSTCQFFNMLTNTWDTNGCAPTDESIENYAVCECEHLTPFGGGMLAPPNVLSFADLVNLDLFTNPVVFVTCSLIFVVYVVSVIICRKLDQSNLERISSIPLCGKDGSFKYEVTVITGRQPGAGTTANVGVKLYGEYGKTNSKQLDKKWAFQRNCQDTFIMAHDVNLGNIEKLMIWHDNSGLDPSWYVVQVIVKDMQTDHKYYFFANFWMSLEMEKGFVQKELYTAGSSEIYQFGRMFSRAVSNCMADRHLWYSVIDRPAQSRFTRVQRATCVITILYTFMAINAMWYGLLKQQDTAEKGWASFGWEEVVLSLITNVMAFPFSLLIIWMFKRSKSKTNIFEQGNRLGTAQTIEIDYDPNLAGSFKTNDDLISCYDRESTTDSLMQATMTQHHLRRSKTLKMTRQATDDSLNKAVNSFDSGIGSMGTSTEGKLKRTNNPHMWSKGDVTHKDETYITKNEQNSKSERKEEVKEVADGILQYLDDVESECMIKEQTAIQKRNSMGGGARSSLKRTATKKSDWKEVDDILQSDSESKSRPLRKKDSTSTIGSYGKPTSSQSGKGYNPREDPHINGHDRKPPTSAGSTFIWANKLRASNSMDSATIQQSSMPAVQGIGPLEPDMGLAQQSNPELDRGEMQLLERREESSSCTLPAWFVYIAYVICFLLCVTSVVLVIMYGQQFGADVALQWILALLFCIAMSFIIIEPLKAVVIAFYASSILKKEDTTDDDAIDIQPTVDTSNEKVKENKFTPLAGFALLNAKEEGQKIRRMRVMLRQFIAYVFYLWLLMALCYVNFSYDTYIFKSSIDDTILQTTVNSADKSFINISDVDEFWSWSKSALADGLHHRELYTDLEFGTLLGVARMRLVRSVNEPCPADEHPLHSGLESLTNRTCWGNYGYNEDENHYSEGWNLSQNLSWQYSSASQTGSKTRYGYVYTYGGGGYVQNLGTTYNDTLDILQNLQTKNWIDERTRAIFIDFTMYSAANDLSTVVNLMIEFPLTGGLNTSSDVESQVLLRFVTNVVDPLMVCQCILFLVNIYLVCHIFNSIKDNKKEFFKEKWNLFEMLTTLMAIVVNGLYIGCVVEATSTFNDFFDNKYGFTNFETISDTHVTARYVQGILIFLLMIKVMKQLRFIKFLYIYERTLSDASGKLFGVALIFLILFCTYGMAGYLWYGREVDGFETYWHTLTSIVGMHHGHFSFGKLLDHQPVFTHFFLYFYYAFCYGITIALILSILNDTYKTTKDQMYFKATMDMQDYEMVEFIMKRFKLWAGLNKPKQGIRRVTFERRVFSASSQSSRPSSRDSDLSYDPFETNPRTTSIVADRLEDTWQNCLCTLERVCGLDAREEDMVKTTQKEIDEWKFQNRMKSYERELQSCSDKPPKGAPSGTNVVRVSKIPRRTSTTGSEAGNSKRGLGTPDARNIAMRGRPLSDQGGRAKPPPKRTNSRERFSIYKFLKSINPSKGAWN